jgi:hypothetical protein
MFLPPRLICAPAVKTIASLPDATLDVTALEKVFAPAIVCVPVVTTPGCVASTGWRVSTCPDSDAPFAEGDEPTAARVTSPVLVPERFDALTAPLNVLSPAMVWVVVERTPPWVPSAGWSVRT